MPRATVLVLGLIASTVANAELYPLDDEQWTIEGVDAEVTIYLGRQALRLQGSSAILNHLSLEDGIIEYDIAVQSVRGFAGAIFRMQDARNFEHFYIRPHQSGHPDANQYTPVFNGISAWQLYHGTGYGVPVDYRYDEWMHIKIAFAGTRAEVYIDSDEPTLVISELKRNPASGQVGINASSFAPAHFSNVEVSVLPKNYQFREPERLVEQSKSEVVSAWEVSDPFDGRLLVDTRLLDKSHRDGRKWTRLAAERSGIANLAKINGIAENADTVFARFTVFSKEQQSKALQIGYSDSVTVFTNGQRLYSGSNAYQSRDYRYLGTVGWFDTVYLPLIPGANEIWIAVTESFGGWGIQARFDDVDGIDIRH